MKNKIKLSELFRNTLIYIGFCSILIAMILAVALIIENAIA